MDRLSTRSSSSSALILPGYRVGKTLGIGAFGKVKLAEHVLTGNKVAVKILKRERINDSERERVIREIKILRLFAHPHIIRLYEVIETRTNIFVITEYIDRGELFDHITERGKLEEAEARCFFQQIIYGVEFCHLNMVVHRDLKPENVLLDSKRNIKIADFGLSNVMRDGHFLKTSCGSPNYAAPEVISGQLYAGPEVDVWSCGVILYALLCGKLPFDADNFPVLYQKIKSGKCTLPSHLSAGASDLINQILVVDPIKRITIPEIRQHPWFQHHLPVYLAVPATDVMRRVKKIDEGILNEVVKIGFDRNEVIESLQNRIQNEATVTYHLLCDNQFRVSHDYRAADLGESSECIYSGPYHGDRTSLVPMHSIQQQEYMNRNGIRLKPQFPSEERKWALGLQSRAPPCIIMAEVLKALQRLNVCWKKIGHYTMKCKWLPSFASYPGTSPDTTLRMNSLSTDAPAIAEINGVVSIPHTAVKFEMQLYKTKEEKYLLDLQMVNGPPFLFLEICAAFLAQLQEDILVSICADGHL